MDRSDLKFWRPLPVGHYRVDSGPILPDDLCLSVMTGEWLRFDDERWMSPATMAEDAFMVARKARHSVAAGQSSRAYMVQRETPVDEHPAPRVERDQGILF